MESLNVERLVEQKSAVSREVVERHEAGLAERHGLRRRAPGILALPLIGTTSEQRIRNIAGAFAIQLDNQDWYELYTAAKGGL